MQPAPAAVHQFTPIQLKMQRELEEIKNRPIPPNCSSSNYVRVRYNQETDRLDKDSVYRPNSMSDASWNHYKAYNKNQVQV